MEEAEGEGLSADTQKLYILGKPKEAASKYSIKPPFIELEI